MAMRITTKMIQNTSIRNLTINKQRQEKLIQQMATGKKITRPSDDPVTAIRALKLNSSLDRIDQYYERNAEDAVSWLDLTDKAIDTAVKIVGDKEGMTYKLNQIANTYLEYSDKLDIAKELVSFAEEYYSVGNADSAGRSLFTGYRTDLPLVFKEPKSDEMYKITEQRTKLNMDKITYVASGRLRELNEGNFNEKDASGSYKMNTTEYDVTMHDIYRFRLAYDNTDAVNPVQERDANGNLVFDLDADGKPTIPVYVKDPNNAARVLYEPNVKFAFKDSAGTPIVYSVNAEYDNAVPPQQTSNDIKFFANATEEAYKTVVNDPDAVVYIASTGEVLLGNNVKQQISGLESDAEIRLSYEKSEWKRNDIDPIHYFYAERKHPTQDRMIVYNEHFLTDPTPSGKQIIEYDIGNNQTIRVNTTADELFTHDVGRDVNELQQMITEEGIMLTNLEKIENMIASGKYVDDELAQLQLQQKALAKAKESLTDTVKKRSGELLTRFKKYLENINVASTNCGARGARLELIKNRLGTQQENYEELVSKNEDADSSELTVQLSSIKTTYDAALSSIAYVMQTSLLDYIR